MLYNKLLYFKKGNKMKKLMMIAAMMVATVSASAQFEPGTFSLQPKVGMTLSKVSNMPAIGSGAYKIDRSLLTGAAFGVEAEYQIAKPFSVAAGFLFSMQGCQWADTKFEFANAENFEIKDAKVALNYANIPVVANFYLFKGFAIKAGVQFGFLCSAKVKATMKEGGLTISEDESIKDHCKKVDISIPVGVSYQVPTIPIYIDARANFGVTNIFKDEIMVAGEKNSKNQVFQLTVGYKFAL